MIRISLTSNQFANARFAISPLLQLSMAIIRIRTPGSNPGPWLPQRWRSLTPGNRALLEQLVSPATGYIPDFINPYPRTDRPTLDDELAAVCATPRERLREELGRAVRLGPVSAEYAAARGTTVAEADARRRTPTELERAAWEDPRALTEPTAEALAEAWSLLMEPSWPLIRGVLDADIWYRVRQISAGGVQDAVLDLLGGDRWNGSILELDTPIEADISHRTGVIVFAPCVLDALPPLALLCAPTPNDLYLGYPCRGHGLATGPFSSGRAAEVDVDAGLSDLVGATRLRVIDALTEPHSGRALASRLGVSAATVSYHLGRMHRGGLVERRRVGKEVLYSLTDQAARIKARA